MAPTENETLVLTWDALTWTHALLSVAAIIGLLIYVGMAAFTARMIARKFYGGDEHIGLSAPVFGGIFWPIAPAVVFFFFVFNFAVRLGYRAAGPRAPKETASNLPKAKVVDR